MTPAEELRKVYAEAVRNEQPSENSMSGWHAAGLLAVAKFAIERQLRLQAHPDPHNAPTWMD